MAKAKVAYVCNDCGADFPRWQGQCNACGAWNKITEVKLASGAKSVKSVESGKTVSEARKSAGYAGASGAHVYTIDQIDTNEGERMVVGIKELDRVLGGGLTIGSIVLLTGDPGAGKTTLLSKVAEVFANKGVVLYNTAEESLGQFATRGKGRLRLQYDKVNMKFGNTANLEELIAMIESTGAKIVFLDSIQAIKSENSNGDAGGISQVKHCATELNIFCKQNGVTLIMIGHVNKDSAMAGPKVLEHVIDTSIHIDVGDSLRTLRARKNRFGDTDQIGLFQMHETGMVSVDNPSKLFLTRSDRDYSGLATTCIRDGARNILIEVQALVTEAAGEKPMRNTIGIHYNRLTMITAVMSKALGTRLFKDIHVNLVGGMKLPETETSTDLALAAALYSSDNDKAIPRGMCFFGELSLTGEIRPISNGVPRVVEASMHGFDTVVIPKRNYHKDMEKEGGSIKIVQIEHLSELKELLS